jgi:chemotaxis protein MotB
MMRDTSSYGGVVGAHGLRTALCVAVLVSSAGCVKKSTHQAALTDLARVRVDREELRAQMEAQLEACEARTREEANARAASEASLNSQLDALQNELDRTERRRDQAEARFEEARAEVHRLELVLSERGGEYRRLEQRLQALSAIEREVRQRNQIYEEVIGRFESLIDAGRLTVSIVRGRMVIQMPQDILFESGSATIGTEGRRTIAEVADVLADLEGRSFQVEGHTDDVPIATARFPSNWELSTGRALSVVRLLVDRGVPPAALSGAGYGEFQPVAENASAEGRRRNRRIEIVMLPNLDVIATAQVPGER